MSLVTGAGLMTRLLARVKGGLRAAWGGLRRRSQIEAEMAEEFRHHLELRTEDLIHGGLAPAEAARQARLEFGHLEGHKEDARASRGLRLFDEVRFSWLDVKLGLRMLAKYPGLSLISVVGMAVAIAIGAGAFSMISAMLDPTLPLPASERVVSLQNSTDNPGNPDHQLLHDFLLWRQDLASIDDVTAFRTRTRNLITVAGGVDLVAVAEMSASGFRVARVAPVLGRPLLDEDERPGALPVLVIAEEEWERRFSGRGDIIGHSVRLGGDVHTIVGVMPEGFGFPLNHRFWSPLRVDPTDHALGEGPALRVFGRLAPGVMMEEAQAELTTIGRRLAAESPETHGRLRPTVLPYTHPFFDIDTPGFTLALRGLQFAISLLLILVALNVAVLVYARTATRTGEITLRTALGASRKRVVTQLFAEAFVLSSIAAGIGLLIAGIALREVQEFLVRASKDEVPFWFDVGLTPSVAAYVAGLAVLAGVIVGVLPALKATGSRVQAGLQQLSSRSSGMQLGRTWTTLIVAQVAVAVAVLPFSLFLAGQSVLRGTAEPAYAVDEVLVAALAMEREDVPSGDRGAAHDSADQQRYLERSAELIRRLEAEPEVAGIVFAQDAIHRRRYARVEVEGAGTQSAVVSDVGVDFFDVLDLPLLSGRGFVEGDAREGSNIAIVDGEFARRVLGGDPLGRRIRQIRHVPGQGSSPTTVEEGPWLEVVGVVPPHVAASDLDPLNVGFYRPRSLADLGHIGVGVRVRGVRAPGFASRLREITASVDPLLQLEGLRTAAEIERNTRHSILFLGLVIMAVTTTVLLLSAAGIYAMMSFTVARRRREIGIRSALGAAPRRVIGGIFARASGQLSAGILAGLVLAVAIDRAMGGGPIAGRGVLLIPMVAAIIVTIGLLAAVGPARRILAVQPTEALRDE